MWSMLFFAYKNRRAQCARIVRCGRACSRALENTAPFYFLEVHVMSDQKKLQGSIIEILENATMPLSGLYEILSEYPAGNTVTASSVEVVMHGLLYYFDHKVREDLDKLFHVPTREELEKEESDRALVKDLVEAMTTVKARITERGKARAEMNARKESGDDTVEQTEGAREVVA